MGGKLVSQTFHCTKCKTIWTPDDNNWAFSKRIQCPFCNKIFQVAITMKDGKLTGEILSKGVLKGGLDGNK
jgi:hypothetical protein